MFGIARAVGKKHYGDRLYKRAAEITGLTEGTLQVYASVSRNFELLTRVKGLTFKHH